MLESTFEKKFFAEVKSIPRTHVPFKEPSQVSIRGNPDRVICLAGIYVAIECKRSLADALKGSSSSKLQDYERDQVIRAGGYSVLVYPENAALILEKLREISNEQSRNYVLRAGEVDQASELGGLRSKPARGLPSVRKLRRKSIPPAG